VKKPKARESNSDIPLLGDPTTRRLAIVNAAGLVACIVSRAPTLLTEAKIPVIDVKLDLNAGYVLIFGPLAAAVAAAVIWYLIPRTPVKGAWTAVDKGIVAFLFALLPVICGFLALQFFLLLAPPGSCPSFDRWHYLTGIHLKAFKPEYCMGLPSATQESMPWLLDPPIVQAWLQVLLPLITAMAMIAGWRSWSGRCVVRAS
jgi:hypothetical protein